ncbi:MAG: hypothetical protein WAN50_01990 [Minisyncoccia bacterium]
MADKQPLDEYNGRWSDDVRWLVSASDAENDTADWEVGAWKKVNPPPFMLDSTEETTTAGDLALTKG